MKEVWVMRHGPQETTDEPGVWQPNAPLTKEGTELVKRVREAHLQDVQFSFFGSSPFRRANETAVIVAGREHVEMIPGLATISQAAWEWIFRDREYSASVHTPAVLFAEQPGLMVAEGDRVFRSVQHAALSRLEEGERALLVSHQPLIEMALAVTTNIFPPELSLQKGEIVIFSFKNDRFTGDWRHLPLPCH